jgi:nucleotide-binding universal stress UspA family protein
MIVAVPILDPKDVPWATAKAIDLYRKKKARIHLVNVRQPFPKHISRFFSATYLDRVHTEDGLERLASAMKALETAGVPYWKHVLVGRKLEQIVDFVTSHHCGEVVLRDKPENLLSRLGLSSANSKTRRALKARYG